jgi:hypothetical protein
MRGCWRTFAGKSTAARRQTEPKADGTESRESRVRAKITVKATVVRLRRGLVAGGGYPAGIDGFGKATADSAEDEGGHFTLGSER